MRQVPSPPPFQFNAPLSKPKKKLTCLGCVGIFFGIAVCSGIIQTIGRVMRGEPWDAPAPVASPPTAPVSTPKLPVANDRTNLASKIKVLGTSVAWHPGAGNPHGPDLIWVKVRLRNDSKVPVGVIYAHTAVYDRAGHRIGGAEDEVLYLSTGEARIKLAPGKVWSGAKDYLGEPYVPMREDTLEVVRKQPVRVKVEVFGAYANPKLGTKGQMLDM